MKRSSPPSDGKRVVPTKRLGPKGIEYQNNTLKRLIEEAYELQRNQVTGPDWLDTESYDLTATFPPATKRGEVPAMLQALLAERLRLAVHRQQRVEPVYAVGVGPGGSRLLRADPDDWDNGTVRLGQTGIVYTGNMSMRALLNLISPFFNRHIIDSTRLKDVYDITLEFPQPDPRSAEPMGIGVAFALQKQLGLTIVAGEGTVEVIVVDHVERIPIEN